jgi:hypothetical protein
MAGHRSFRIGIGGDVPGQDRAGPGEATTDGADAQVQLGGHLLQREVQHVVQEQNGALVGRHPAQQFGEIGGFGRERGRRSLGTQPK